MPQTPFGPTLTFELTAVLYGTAGVWSVPYLARLRQAFRGSTPTAAYATCLVFAGAGRIPTSVESQVSLQRPCSLQALFEGSSLSLSLSRLSLYDAPLSSSAHPSTHTHTKPTPINNQPTNLSTNLSTNQHGMAAAAEKVGPVVIGAGVVGLAVARALGAVWPDAVWILEWQAHFGQETSARNSEVVHGGLYYPQPSLKARFCVQGREQLYRYCDERQIDYWKMGKLVVATAPDQWTTTVQLHQQAQENGYMTTKLINADEVTAMEPNLQTCGALWSPETGVVDSHGLMTSFLAEAEERGATLVVQSPVDDAKITNNGAIQLCIGGTWISSTCVINCAGLWAHKVARLMHPSSDNLWSPPRQYYCRGNYFRLTGVSPPPFSYLVYPVPDRRGGLGVHATLDRSHQVKFGPDVQWLPVDTDPDDLDYVTDQTRLTSFYESIRTYWPDLPDHALQEDYVGVRPKLSHPELSNGTAMPFQDFVIAGPRDHGVPGLIHLFGIESPGLTSCLVIADHVVQLVR